MNSLGDGGETFSGFEVAKHTLTCLLLTLTAKQFCAVATGHASTQTTSVNNNTEHHLGHFKAYFSDRR